MNSITLRADVYIRCFYVKSLTIACLPTSWFSSIQGLCKQEINIHYPQCTCSVATCDWETKSMLLDPHEPRSHYSFARFEFHLPLKLLETIWISRVNSAGQVAPNASWTCIINAVKAFTTELQNEAGAGACASVEVWELVYGIQQTIFPTRGFWKTAGFPELFLFNLGQTWSSKISKKKCYGMLPSYPLLDWFVCLYLVPCLSTVPLRVNGFLHSTNNANDL